MSFAKRMHERHGKDARKLTINEKLIFDMFKDWTVKDEPFRLIPEPKAKGRKRR